MSFHTALSRDLDMIAHTNLGPGEPVLFTSADGVITAVMHGFFDEPGAEVTPGSAQAPVNTAAPVLHLPESELSGVLDRPLRRLDRFEIRGVVYTVQRPMPDGFGLLRISLHKNAPPAGAYPQTPGVVSSQDGNGRAAAPATASARQDDGPGVIKIGGYPRA